MDFIKVNKENYNQIAAIYREGLATNMSTFETKVPDWKTWKKST
ncbi:hypothetical protein [uncultured Polaribacter sp.]|nr:hypothetical protein [uncultured Polaribacter sp.]